MVNTLFLVFVQTLLSKTIVVSPGEYRVHAEYSSEDLRLTIG